jgi:hypothetical protein
MLLLCLFGTARRVQKAAGAEPPAIEVAVDGQVRAKITPETLARAKPDVQEGVITAWRLRRFAGDTVERADTMLVVQGDRGETRLRVERDLVAFVVRTRPGRVQLTLAPAGNPLAAFHGGGWRSRPLEAGVAQVTSVRAIRVEHPRKPSE